MSIPILPFKFILVVVGSALSLGALFLGIWSVEKVSAESLTNQIRGSMTDVAGQVRNELERSMIEKAHRLTNIAVLLSHEQDGEPTLKLLNQSINAETGFTSLSELKTDNKVLAIAGNVTTSPEAIASQPAWQKSLGEASGFKDAAVLSPLGHYSAQGLEFLAPIRDGDGHVKAHLIAVSGWTQAAAKIGSLQSARDPSQHLEIFLLGDDGHVNFGPAEKSQTFDGKPDIQRALRSNDANLLAHAVDTDGYITGVARSNPKSESGNEGLVIVVRQSDDIALAPLQRTHFRIAAICLLFAFHVIIFHWLTATKLVAPLLSLAQAADRFRQDGAATVPHLQQFAEVKKLSESMIAVLDELKRKETSLEDLNASLESQVRDRTRALELQNELLEVANTKAERATFAKSRLLASASHDLRQPLHALDLYFHALKRRQVARDTANIIDQLENALHSLKTMLDGLLHISRLDSGLVPCKMTALRLKDIVERIGASYSIEAEQRGLHFAFSSQDCHISSDPVLLETVIRNLVSNAFKFTKTGGLILAGRSMGENAIVEVYDTGPGIPVSRLDSIFHEFERNSTQANGPNDGLGLGLSIVERHAKLIGADVAVRSIEGRGTRFRVTLPKTQATFAPVEKIRVTPLPTTNGLHVMLVDDHPDSLAALRIDLSDRGASVSALQSPSLAMEALTAGLEVDIAIVDYDLDSTITGVELVEKFRCDGWKFPVLILTGRTDSPTLKIVESHGLPWLTKPVTPDTLAATISRLATVKLNSSHEKIES